MNSMETMLPPEAEMELEIFLQSCAKQAVRLADSAAFLEWVGKHGPDLMPRMASQVNPAAGTQAQFFRSLGRQIWTYIPLPHRRFARERFADPGRNEPCYCGSGRKFKHCCAHLPSLAASGLPVIEMLPYVLDVLPKKRWAELPGSDVALDAVCVAAFRLLDEDRAEDAIKLLEPWFPDQKAWPNRLAPMFDLLLDAYESLGKRKKRKAMASMATEHGEPQVAAVGWQRLAVMLSDEGDSAGAWKALGHAQRADPDNVSLGLLEVTMLLSAQDWEQARRRAQFWATRLLKTHGPEEADAIEFLRRVAADPRHALVEMNEQRVPGLESFRALLDAAPAVACEFRLHPEDGLAGPLDPSPALQRARNAWQTTFPSIQPFSVQMSTFNDSAWPVIDEWLPVLQKHTVLWQDFHVLDDLVCALDGLNTLGVAELVRRLTDRALVLLDLVLSEQQAAGMQLEWGFLENRPALRLVVRHILDRLDEGDEAAALPWIERMVNVLNPNDNHGLRDLLMNAYLRQGRFDAAIALGERYSDDFATMQYHRALAHFLAGDRTPADAILRDALKNYPLIGKALLSKRAAAPKDGPITLGSQNEANLYRAEYGDLWTSDALAWLSDIKKQQAGTSA